MKWFSLRFLIRIAEEWVSFGLSVYNSAYSDVGLVDSDIFISGILLVSEKENVVDTRRFKCQENRLCCTNGGMLVTV
jgi:hypothetical protein